MGTVVVQLCKLPSVATPPVANVYVIVPVKAVGALDPSVETRNKDTKALELPAAPVILAPSLPIPLCITAVDHSPIAIVSVEVLALAADCLTHAYSPATKDGTAVVQLFNAPSVLTPPVEKV